MDIDERYYPYSKYLKKRYGEKVYKLPVNLPVTCPNRISGAGCSFCAETGTGFEAMDSAVSVTEQLMSTRKYIEKRYHAHKFIAYFQNYTNTFMPLDIFQKYMLEASKVPDIVEIAISTRPDCIREDYLDVLNRIRETTGIQIAIELGLQTVNYHTLKKISRGHTLAEYIDAVLLFRIEILYHFHSHRTTVCLWLYRENVLLQSEREEPIISWRFQSNHPSHLLADLKSHEYRYHNHIC